MSEPSPAVKAFVAAQAAMTTATKDSENQTWKYASLQSVQEACFPALHDNGFCVMQPVIREGECDFVETRILHEEGEIFTTRVPLIVQKNDMQAYGSAVTYARRYGLMALSGIAPEDDDGNAAVKSAPKKEPQKKTQVSGPLGISDLRKFSMAYVTDLGACDDLDTFEAMKTMMVKSKGTEYPVREVLSQVMRDLPDTWHGTEDGPGIKELMEKKKEYFEAKANRQLEAPQ